MRNAVGHVLAMGMPVAIPQAFFGAGANGRGARLAAPRGLPVSYRQCAECSPPKFIGGLSQVIIGPSSVPSIVAFDSLDFAIAPPTVGVARKAFLWDMILIYRRMHRVGLSMWHYGG